ncbi:twisted gastrulation protein homolog 1-A-like [Asterias rubens]|uniref:twisted gastrulation protein homolog 1-A-like n=1 Tax=Asterias rubens TaxID=7604 RepID=UPI001455C104|nr:twisted gastrulation protein homolog 1-A-like [Asterias rubens]
MGKITSAHGIQPIFIISPHGAMNWQAPARPCRHGARGLRSKFSHQYDWCDILITMIDRHYLTLALLAILWACAIGHIIGCNENRCASEVSKCQLIGSCGCRYEAENCSCCLNCSRCLADYWEECCSCTGLCRAQGQSPIPEWRLSTLLELTPLPSLFQALTSLEASQDPNLRWIAMPLTLKEQGLLIMPPGKTMEEEESPIFTSVNSTGLEECVVAYMDDCTSLGKCENTCRSMGAARQRWFHNGCCECVGSSCLSYGKNEPQCKECPIEDY